MPTPAVLKSALEQIRDQRSFIDCLLREALEWPIDSEARTVEEISFKWSAQELRDDGLTAKLVDGKVMQIRPFRSDQPWGVFLLEFKNPEVFRTDRGMAGTLRTVLRGLVKSGRKQSTLPSWKQENLLFICNHDYKDFRFASFRADPKGVGASRIAAFGWGPEMPARTAWEFNLPPLAYDPTITSKQWVAQWTDAFDVEKVGRKFYKDYADVFAMVKKALKGPKNDEERHLIAQTLMNRLMFLRFVERKGWLTINKRTDYLQALAEAGSVGRKSIYRSRLEPLFEALGIPARRDFDAVGDVPFLGGGLFERTPQDETLKDVPDEALLEIIGGGDRPGLFYQYNFTVEESTPLDIDVAVDPEMLGRVFEALVTGRHESGSYYTPRTVVTFMCREALKGFLEDKAKLPAPLSTMLVDDGDVSDLKESQARDVIAALDTLTAVDPACGSGAYLLGLLHELIRLHSQVMSEKLKRDRKWLYDRKLWIISHNLYGVDIDPFATNIAMLRLWLSLVVEADEPVPLPNLDFKIETGDALLGPDPHSSDELFGDALVERADKLIALKDEYLYAQGEKRAALRARIDKEIADISFQLRGLRGDGIIDWRIQFAEVFVKRKGFDVVLANPPYVRQELIKDSKPALKKIFPDYYSGTADLYVYFYLRAFQLLNPGGMLVFISSNKWFRARYGEKLRTLFATEVTVRIILDFHDLPVFESAIAYPMIFIASKGAPAESDAPVLVEPGSLDPPYPDVRQVVVKCGQRLPRTALGVDGDWYLAASGAADILRKVRDIGPTLSDYVSGRIYRGVLTGLNDAFVVTRSVRDQLVREDRGSTELLKPFARGRDIKRWRVESEDLWLIFTRRGIDIKRYPAIEKHLRAFKKELMPGGPDGRKPGTYAWYEIQDNIAYWQEFEKPKIIVPAIQNDVHYAPDTGAFYSNDKTSIIVPENVEFLLGILNSRVSWWLTRQLFASKQSGFYEFKPMYVSQIPIPAASSVQQATVQRIVQHLVQLTRLFAAEPGSQTSRDSLMLAYWERLLNGLAYELYFRDEVRSARLFDLINREELPAMGPESDIQAVSRLRGQFEKVYEPTHQIRIALDTLQTLDLVRTIEA